MGSLIFGNWLGNPNLPPPQRNSDQCDVDLPTDPNLIAAITAVFGEASEQNALGKNQYGDQDIFGNPTGPKITEGILQNESTAIASVIFNCLAEGTYGKDILSV